MDFTKRNKVRDKDFSEISQSVIRTLFRTDIEDIFNDMIIEKNLNTPECNLIRKHFENIVMFDEQHGMTKTSYYHVALELYNKVITKNNNISTWNKIVKENKLNSNELEMLKIVLATNLSWGLLKASLK